MKSLLQRVCRSLFGSARTLPMPKYQGRPDGLHELTEDYTVEVAVAGIKLIITVRQGFAFDGASIPPLIWPVLGHPMTPPRVAAALIHDWLHKSQVVSKWAADLIYAKVQAMCNIPYPSIVIEWIALVFFSSKYWRENAQGDILGAREYGLVDFRAIPPEQKKEREQKT